MNNPPQLVGRLCIPFDFRRKGTASVESENPWINGYLPLRERGIH